ncbi:hypothetical protein DPMN_044069 [Dreissena polymorpha]|uniref:Uncharacterized protein n=1 Tax=Dreissena polymorpha TaxID=45954 RepID=A0A9D4D1L7_DREPO|nr:hypothetical protein DPMN_044069 [Dreissena polymorpha]
MSVCYSSTTSSIIVGQVGRDNILVFRSLLSQDNDAEDVVDKDYVTTQKSVTELYKMIPAETNKGENFRSAQAQSTSIDIEFAKQPHESRLQEPKSRTTLPLP